MAYSDIGSDSTTDWFASRLAEQGLAHDGRVLKEWANAVLHRLPRGSVILLSISVEGCALGAVVSALREESTSWDRLVLRANQPKRADVSIVVVEPVRLGSGTTELIQQLLPTALILDGFGMPPELTAVA